MQNFNAQFSLIGVSMGFDAAELLSLANDNDAFQWLAQNAVEIDAFAESVRQYRKNVTEGSIGSPKPEFPVNPAGTPPMEVDAGLFERLVKLVERIRVAPTYTPEIGALLGIIPSKSDSLTPEEMQPDPVLMALPGNIVQINFIRGKTEGIDVQIQLDNSGQWESAGRFYKSPAEITIPQNLQSTARSVQVRARYVINNSSIGQYSDTDNVSTIP